MLPRRFALVRHVDYSGAAGTGVIAYGVAFDDGQVVLRWSSAHQATSVLDSVEDLIAAHGHGETTSIEWIDAPPGEADAPAQQGGRRARRPSPQEDAPPVTEVPRMPNPLETAPAEPVDVRSAANAPQPRAPADAIDARPAAHAQQTPVPLEPAEAYAVHVPQAPSPPEPANARPAQAPQAPVPSPAEAGHTTAPVPTAPAASARPAASAQPPAPPIEPSAPPNGAPGLSAPRAPAGHEPAPEPPAPLTAAAHAASSPTSDGTTHSSDTAEHADVVVPGAAAPSPAGPAPAQPDATSRVNRNSDRRSYDRGADVIDHQAAGRGADDERRRHEAIATQPMNADFSEDRGQQQPRRAAAPMHESPRSIFEEAEEPARPDLRLASSNGRSHGPDESADSEDTSPGRDDFGGFFSPGHQHLDTVTGLLDLPAGLDKRGRGPGAAEQDAIASRRNGRHRGE